MKQMDFNSIQLICRIADGKPIKMGDGAAGFDVLHSQRDFNDVKIKVMTNSRALIDKALVPYINPGNAGKRCIISGRCFFTDVPTVILTEIKFIDKFVVFADKDKTDMIDFSED